MDKKSLKALTDQQINILVGDKLGLNWYLSPVDNEYNPWTWEFSKITGGRRVSLANYCGGQGITGIMVAYEIGAAPTWMGQWKVGNYYYEGTPWRGVCEEFLLNVEVELCD
jgi:hypothetical protein